MSLNSQRNNILRRAVSGDITGEEADAEAERLGIGPLSCAPDPEAFDPERLSQWPLVMAIAWIAFRSKDAVRDAWPDYVEQCWHWMWRKASTPAGGGWHLEQRERPTIGWLGLNAALAKTDDELPRPVVSIREARESLWVMLREGNIQATGISTRTGDREAIPPGHWQDLVPFESRGQADEVRFGQLGEGYRDVLLPSKGMRWIWKPPEPTRMLGPTVSPEGDGHMPLCCAAQWIATEGGRKAFDAEDSEVWKAAYTALLNAIASGHVEVLGLRDGQREPVPPYQFADCRVDHPFIGGDTESDNLFLGDAPYLLSWPWMDEQHWNGGLNDCLMSRFQPLWERLIVARADIRARWSFELEPQRSGAPGRPNSMHFVLTELEQRIDAGDLKPSAMAQARELQRWWAENRGANAPLTVHTIRLGIAERFRAAKSAGK